MNHRYVPILRWKRGEKTALRNVSALGQPGVVPLLLLQPDRYVGKDQSRTRPAVSAAAMFAQHALQAWNNFPLYLDASELPPSPGGPHPLEEIGQAARSLGVTLVPATTLSAPPVYEAAVSALHQADRLGVGLRIDLQELTSMGSWLPAWSPAPEETDLVVDLGDNVAAVHALGSTINVAFQQLPAAGQWRTVTLAGTSIPENFSGYKAGLATLPRIEWTIWQRITGAGLPYRLDYGDYATIPVVPPPTGIAWGFPINVKYTLVPEFLICRGVRTTGINAVDMDLQLIGHARSIVSYRSRGRLSHCWADNQIDAIASQAIEPGNLENWVSISMNRHIELIRVTLP